MYICMCIHIYIYIYIYPSHADSSAAVLKQDSLAQSSPARSGNKKRKKSPLLAWEKKAIGSTWRGHECSLTPNVPLPQACDFRACGGTCVLARFRETLRVSPPSSAGAEVACSPRNSHVLSRQKEESK